MFHDLVRDVTTEIAVALKGVDEQRINEFIALILDARRIVVHGSGRVGFACKGFAMRLGHLGKTAYNVGDSTLPSIGKDDLVIVASSSGETQTIYDVGLRGKQNHARLAAITVQPESRIAKLADVLLLLKTPTRLGSVKGAADSLQPMATLFEQSLQILFDVVVLMLMKKTAQSHSDLHSRHSNLD